MMNINDILDDKKVDYKPRLFNLSNLVIDKFRFLQLNDDRFKYLSLFKVLSQGNELLFDEDCILIADVQNKDLGTLTEDVILNEEIQIICRTKDYKNNSNQIIMLKGLLSEIYEIFHNQSNPKYNFDFYKDFKILSKLIYEDNLKCRTLNITINANTNKEYDHYEKEFNNIKLMVETRIEE